MERPKRELKNRAHLKNDNPEEEGIGTTIKGIQKVRLNPTLNVLHAIYLVMKVKIVGIKNAPDAKNLII